MTGGAGFLGSHLCDRLLEAGHAVIAMDNLITGSTDNIAHLAGNPEQWTVLQMAEAIRKLAGSDAEIEHRPLPVDDPKVRQPDITRAREELGWTPRVSIEDGLRATVENFRERLDRDRS